MKVNQIKFFLPYCLIFNYKIKANLHKMDILIILIFSVNLKITNFITNKAALVELVQLIVKRSNAFLVKEDFLV